jgi:hypothetical protein
VDVMAIKKEYSTDKTICKVTFTIPKEIAEQFEEISLVGDFNNWDPKANLFLSKMEGVRSVSVELQTNKEYHFRYLGDSHTWLNDIDADKHVPNTFGSENSYIFI